MEALTRFAREAVIVSSIQHLNICDVYDVGELPTGGPYILLERLLGETLAARLKCSRQAPLRELVDIFVQVLAGLQAAHAAHILHRDLKPQNIFLVERVGCTALVELVDFGLARNLSQSDATQLTRPGRRCGTVQYMSPEQLRGQPLDQRSDVFSVGVLLYETLSGRHPFAASTAVELRTNILRGTPAPLQTSATAVATTAALFAGERPGERRAAPPEAPVVVHSHKAKKPGMSDEAPYGGAGARHCGSGGEARAAPS